MVTFFTAILHKPSLACLAKNVVHVSQDFKILQLHNATLICGENLQLLRLRNDFQIVSQYN